MNPTISEGSTEPGVRSEAPPGFGPLATCTPSPLFPQTEQQTRPTALRARAIALYLPQFHPIPENDEWWGKGFTEWTNTAKAKPMFRGHYQPHIPADLGFYDLRVPETREAQAALARQYGIEGFCYYHYWFAGRRILERPFNEVLHSGAPDFPFCLCWANATWSGIWYGEPKRVLIEQTYPGRADHEAHFQTLLPAFKDPRYIRVDDKPVFLIFQPFDLPDAAATLALWRAMAADAGLSGLHIGGMSLSHHWSPRAHGFDVRVAQPGWPAGSGYPPATPFDGREEDLIFGEVYPLSSLISSLPGRRSRTLRQMTRGIPASPMLGIILPDQARTASYSITQRRSCSIACLIVLLIHWNICNLSDVWCS